MIWIIYHNVSCSKCIGTMEILDARDITPRVVNYLETPPSKDELSELLDKLGGDAAAMVRTKAPGFAEAGVDLTDRDAILTALAKHPEWLERPIVVHGNRAVIARPPERVLELL